MGRGRFLLQLDNPLRQAEVRLLGQRPQRPRRMLPLTHSGKLINIYNVYFIVQVALVICGMDYLRTRK